MQGEKANNRGDWLRGVIKAHTKGPFTWREEDPPHVFCIQFTCKRLYLALVLDLSSKRIFLPEIGRFAWKDLVLGTKNKHGGGRVLAAKGRQFFFFSST